MKPPIKQYTFKPNLTQEFEVVDLQKLVNTSGAIVTVPHRAEFYHIIWFQSGTPTHLVDFNSIKIESNSLLFLNQHVVHSFDAQMEFSGKAILFTDRFFYQSASDFDYLKNSILFNDLFGTSLINTESNTQVFLDLFELIQHENQLPKDQFQAPILKNHLHNFLLLAEREKRNQNFVEIKPSAGLDHALLFRDLLDKHFKAEKQVSFYSQQLNITEKLLNQSLKNVLGKTAKDLINSRVLLEAKRLLTTSQLNIKEIAYEIGFDEPGNFIKYFKKYTSQTPTEFREKRR
jgi:AraC family transcriptional activator of pobA